MFIKKRKREKRKREKEIIERKGITYKYKTYRNIDSMTVSIIYNGVF